MKFVLLLSLLATARPAQAAFQRLSTFFVCTQISPTCNTDIGTGAEIVAATPDGNTLVYTDSEYGKIGFVNIVDPANPIAAGIVNFSPGQPNSVAVLGPWALAVINTSPNFVNTSGYLAVINISNRTVVHNITLPGQPDSITVSGSLAAIAIENERNEAFNNSGVIGGLPQLPPGYVVLVNTSDANPTQWTTIAVDISNLPNILFNTDPEPEYVTINSQGITAVTLQENNGIVLINSTGSVIASYSAGAASLSEVDTVRENSLINQTSSTTNIQRQPDGIAWIDDTFFVTADEGDIGTGGSRTFTVFDARTGNVAYSSLSTMEWLAVKYGHYPDQRNAKGVEPETPMVATFGGVKHLFIVTERASAVFVYDITNPASPTFVQILATSTSGPEGITAIPNRNLIAVANEVDGRTLKFRSSISIYRFTPLPPDYPVLESVPRTANTFIPFSALSSLAAYPPFGGPISNPNVTTLYTVEDSFFRSNRIMTIEVTKNGPPYKITSELRIRDLSGNLQAALGSFPSVSIAARINADKTVNIDPEGIAISRNTSTVWVASEGAGEPTITLPNLLLRVRLSDGNILSAITLPPSVNAIHTRFGFEGVAEYGDYVVCAFQRAWTGEANPRLGIYNTATSTWKFVFYPLDPYSSQYTTGTAADSHWVGLSEISPIGNGKFLILERDNNGGPDAAIKRLYEIDLGSNLSLLAENTTITKSLRLDMIPLLKTTWGLIPEKVEGCAIDAYGNVWVNNDNDGINNNAGEQQLNFMGALYATDISQMPSASPTKKPVKAPVVAPIPISAPVAPVPIPVPVPRAPAAPVPVSAPASAPVVAPASTPVTIPVTAPVRSPVTVPVTTPVRSPVTVPARAPAAVPVPVAAVPTPITAPVSPPQREDCGLFNLNIFCPFTFCGLIGRLFRLCD